jgi:hypothetical protein
MKSVNFWDITPCSPLSINRRFGGTYRRLLAKLISSTLKMEAICSSETSVDTQQTTRRCIPEVYTFLLSVEGLIIRFAISAQVLAVALATRNKCRHKSFLLEA